MEAIRRRAVHTNVRLSSQFANLKQAAEKRQA
jgi:hypothetical protein